MTHPGAPGPHAVAPRARASTPLTTLLGFILSCVAVVLGTALGGMGVLYAGVTVLTGAPGHVMVSALGLFYRFSLPTAGPLALAALILCYLGLRRGARGLRPGEPVGGRRLAIAGIVLSWICLGLLLLGLPLLFTQECFDLYC